MHDKQNYSWFHASVEFAVSQYACVALNGFALCMRLVFRTGACF